jgi:hypothetical protein
MDKGPSRRNHEPGDGGLEAGPLPISGTQNDQKGLPRSLFPHPDPFIITHHGRQIAHLGWKPGSWLFKNVPRWLELDPSTGGPRG